MADTVITRDVYKQYAHKIVSVLKNEDFYEQFKTRVDKGSSSFKLAKKRLIQDISIDWIDTIEEILPNLDTIVRNPRKFIVQEEDIVDVSLARSISTESVKFLAQHTNMISKVDKDGMVTPSKILNITKEESFEIYENRFIYTLLLKLKDFVTMRYDKIKKASATQDVLELDVESRFGLPSKKVTMRTEYFAQLSFDEVMRLDPDTLTKIERVAKIDRIITDFLSSSFAKSMRNSAPVRPPIMRTNVILKEPNFKKALTLWQFIETYNVTGGFSTSDEVENYDLESESVENLKNMVTLNTMLFESMYDQCETDMSMDDKEFADFLRVGEMDFEKDELSRDEYAQKPDDKAENKDEQENVEEVAPDKNGESEQEQESDKATEDKQDQSNVEENKKDADKEVAPSDGAERPVEVVRYVEMPPKADQEEVDLEPDAEKFDKHLFEVRKLYKRPTDGGISREDIAKVNDAIDRCLTSYRRIKQDELNERLREERIRHRRAEADKRAEAFKKFEVNLDVKGSDGKIYFGIDPFGYHTAKIAAKKKDEKIIEERKRLLAEIERAKSEKLMLDDGNEVEREPLSTADGESVSRNEELIATEQEANNNPNTGNVQEEQSADIEEAEKASDADSVQNLDESVKDESIVNDGDAKDIVENVDVEAVVGDVAVVKKNDVSDKTDAEAPIEKAPIAKKKRKKNIEAVDENKVAVGGIRFKDGSDIYDVYNLSRHMKTKRAPHHTDTSSGDSTED